MSLRWLLTCTVLLSSLGWCDEWRLWSPRSEIAPRSSRPAPDELVLEGAGNPAVFGGWERVYLGVQAGQWYRLEVKYRASGLDYEPLQVPVRLDWVTAAGQRAGEPDYAWRVSSTGEWRTVTLDAPAPLGASAVKVQLLLQNAPRAVVHWSGVSFTASAKPAERKVRLTTIRLKPKGDPDPVARFIETALATVPSGSDVILLPEGITVIGTGKVYADVAEVVPGPTTARLGELARARNAWIVAGIYEREGGTIYNTAVLIDRAGKFAGKYRKVYLPREELEGGLTPGSSYPVFHTDFGTVGMMICWDVQYADPARGLALRGAELILMPIAGGNETLAKARAIENHVFLVSSGYDFPSLVIDPAGETLARTEVNGTSASATIDLNRRYLDSWLGDMRGRYFRELRGDVASDPAGRR
jgi:predicted amidohydrolase